MRHNEKQNGLVFVVFCLWTFVLLCRPQDIFPALALLRPALVTGILTLGVVVVNLRSLSDTLFFQERQVKYYTVLLLIMVLSIPFSIYARLSFMTIFTEYINVIIFFYIFYMVVDSVDKLSGVLLLGCLGNGLYMVASVIKGTNGGERLSFGSMFDPNDLAYFALGFLPLNLIFISRDNPRWARLACFASFCIGVFFIFLTGSRGGLLAFGMATAMLLLLKTKTINSRQKAIFLTFGLVIITISSISTERFKSIFTIHEDYNVQAEEGRLAIWKIGTRVILAHPLTGVGVGCISNAVGNDRAARDTDTNKWQTAHNTVIQIGAETGVIGLVLFVMLSWNVFGIFHRVKMTAVSEQLVKIGEMGFVGFAGMFTSAMFLSQAYSLYWAFYVVFSAVTCQLLLREQALAADHS